MRREVTTRLRAAMADAGLDALVSLSPDGFAYAAGFVVPSQPLMRWRLAAHVLRADGFEAIVAVDMEETAVRTLRPDVELHVWAEFGGDAMTTLATALRGLGLAAGRIGIELDYLPVTDHTRLVAALPLADLVPVGPLLERTRQVKTATEIELLHHLSRVADGAIRASFDAVRAGDTEMDLAAALTRSVYEQGVGAYKLMIVATGERSELPNVGPSLRVLSPGDVCRVEIFAVAEGYQAGVCRTAVVGEPSAQATRVYANLAECRALLLDSMAPGVSADAVYRTFRTRFDELGMPAIGFVGHSIGVNLHETPYLAAGVEQPLEAGMVFGIEPLVYRSGHGFGMQIKDMVAITEDGVQVLSDVTPTAEPYRIQA